MSNLKDKIKDSYTQVLSNQAIGCCGQTSNQSQNYGCGSHDNTFAEDYSNQPGYHEEADYGLGCGIPINFAGISEGDIVLDLGSGAGNDAFIASTLTGSEGRVIGVDITPAMIEKANKNKKKLQAHNVEFRLADIEELDIKEGSVDVVISNCVLNMVFDKLATYQSIYKVLRPGGHFSVSDIVMSVALTENLKNITALYAGCIAGAATKDQYLEIIKEAGFRDIAIKSEKVIDLPDEFMLRHVTAEELFEYRASGNEVLSITVNGWK